MAVVVRFEALAFAMKKQSFLLLAVIFLFINTYAQQDDSSRYWHNLPRTVRYHPEGGDIVITNGNRRFTRALYGTNTAFRVEAGDLPEFGMYLPGMGGNLKFGIISGDSSKWLIQAKKIVARYRPGSMLYDITDPFLGKGILHLQVLAMGNAEGMIVKLNAENIAPATKIIWAFGGVSGKKFSRDGDLNVDPESSFYLKPEYCVTNRFSIDKNAFTLRYAPKATIEEVNRYQTMAQASDSAEMLNIKTEALLGFAPASNMHVADASAQASPQSLFQSNGKTTQLITGQVNFTGIQPIYLAFKKPDDQKLTYESLAATFSIAEQHRQALANRIKIQTPDAYINTLGGVIGIAADAIWDAPTFMHGAIGWRMRLPGWRGPYAGDALGWHDRARLHFRSYAKSQLTTPAGALVMDTALHLARSLEKLGTSVYSNGYICRNPDGDFRPNHYDMNLVYMDQLLRHFNWTGDTAFVKEMWPVIVRHLAWEKRNFDPDDDGLYDAYAAIWASDALQYSGGAVTHSSAYNYYANKQAALLAELIGENGAPYKKEAAKIIHAINTKLWMPDKGSYAEFKEMMGDKALHPNAGLWTYYHTLDSDVPNPFQAYQMVKHIDWNTPHIPVRAKGLADSFYTLSTTNWMPYDWSLNNVATAEVMHTALANWQASRNDEAFQLWKSELLSTMYLGASAGNIGQISFYDAARGEAYRDFGDPVGMTSRSLIEGLFGILPDALHNKLLIRPGFPVAWKNASIQTPDITFNFKSVGNIDTYVITPSFRKMLALQLQLKVRKEKIASMLVNGKKANWKSLDSTIGMPEILVSCPKAKSYTVTITWSGNEIEKPATNNVFLVDGPFSLDMNFAAVENVNDPQQLFTRVVSVGKNFLGKLTKEAGSKTAFFQLKQGSFTWWQPINVQVKKAISILPSLRQEKGYTKIYLQNNTKEDIDINGSLNKSLFGFNTKLGSGESNGELHLLTASTIPGTNQLFLSWKNKEGVQVNDSALVCNWLVDAPSSNHYEKVDLTPYFNDKVTQIFKNQYLSPRPKVATLQLPTQGIGDWTHPLKTADINDSGLRKLAGAKNEIHLPQGIPFSTPSDTLKPNIVFTSQWDNYPKQANIPLSGKASHAYFLMAGSTNPMQSRFTNGAVIIHYTDGSSDSLLLKNPETWWPIEQDYMDDGYAFQINAARPVRIHLKTGKIVSDYDNSIAAYAGKMIDGGAATVMDLPLNSTKTLQSFQLQTRASDVVIGIMSITLIRP